MKKFYSLTVLVLASVLFYQCAEKASNDIETTLEEKINVNVEFGFSALVANKNSGASKNSLASSKSTDITEKAKSILISIKDASNAMIYENHKINLARVGDDILSLPLSFTATGTYHITLFQVLDENNVALAMTPRENSILSSAVSTTLDYEFSINVDATNRVNLQVVTIDSTFDAEDFGYSTFSFTEVNLIPFMVGVFSYNATSTNFELISSTITATHLSSGDFIHAGSYAASTAILFTPPLANNEVIQLTVASEGHTTRTVTETYGELVKTVTPQPSGNGPLIVVLNSGDSVIPTVSSVSTPLLYMDANDKSSYNGSGSAWNDLSGNNYNATISGATFTKSGDLGYFDLDGDNDYITWGDLDAVEDKSKISIEMWVRTQKFDGNYNLFNNADTSVFEGGAIPRFATGITSSGKFEIGTANPGDKRLNANTTSPTITLNEWVHVIFVFDGTKSAPTERYDIYVNGSLKDISYSSTYNNTKLHKNSNEVRFGYARDSNKNKHYSDVDLNLLRVYERSLTSSEVLQNYNATRSRF